MLNSVVSNKRPGNCFFLVQVELFSHLGHFLVCTWQLEYDCLAFCLGPALISALASLFCMRKFSGLMSSASRLRTPPNSLKQKEQLKTPKTFFVASYVAYLAGFSCFFPFIPFSFHKTHINVLKNWKMTTPNVSSHFILLCKSPVFPQN